MCDATLRVAARSVLFWLLLIPAAAIAQSAALPAPEPGPVLEAFSLEHQPAGDAIELVRSLLSPNGRVELQGDSNTLIIRDIEPFVSQARETLARFDHPVISIGFTIHLVRASAKKGPSDPGLSPSVIRRLRELLRYESFEERGQADIVSREGQKVAYRVGDDFRVDYRVGTVIEGRSLKLHDFRVFRTAEGRTERPLIHTRLVIRLGQTLVLGLARSEGSGEALMVVIESAPNVVSPILGDTP